MKTKLEVTKSTLYQRMQLIRTRKSFFNHKISVQAEPVLSISTTTTCYFPIMDAAATDGECRALSLNPMSLSWRSLYPLLFKSLACSFSISNIFQVRWQIKRKETRHVMRARLVQQQQQQQKTSFGRGIIIEKAMHKQIPILPRTENKELNGSLRKSAIMVTST